MTGTVTASDPKEEKWGWSVELRDSEGRIAHAKFTVEGKPSMWEMYKPMDRYGKEVK